jgi:hypothetical protein
VVLFHRVCPECSLFGFGICHREMSKSGPC